MKVTECPEEEMWENAKAASNSHTSAYCLIYVDSRRDGTQASNAFSPTSIRRPFGALSGAGAAPGLETPPPQQPVSRTPSLIATPRAISTEVLGEVGLSPFGVQCVGEGG